MPIRRAPAGAGSEVANLSDAFVLLLLVVFLCWAASRAVRVSDETTAVVRRREEPSPDRSEEPLPPWYDGNEPRNWT